MARGSKIKKITGKRGVSYRTTVDVGTDPATGNRKQKVLTAKTRQEVEKLVAQTLADVSRNVYFEPQKMTTSQYLDYWLKNYAKTNVEKTTYEAYETIVNLHIKPFMGATPVSKLTPAHVQEFITNQLTNGNKRKDGCGLASITVSSHHMVLKEALNHAVKWEIIPRNVALVVDPPKHELTEVDPLTVEQTRTIITGLAGTPQQKVTQTASYTGMRIGEILALRWEDIHLDKGFLVVAHNLRQLKDGTVGLGPPKGKKPRTIDLVPEAIAVFKARRKEQAAEKLLAGEKYQDNGFVFCQANGKPYSPKSYSGNWQYLVESRTGIKAHPHQFRHTAATLMLEAGVPMKNVSEMLGHADIGTTDKFYAHITPSGQRDAAQKLAQALNQ